MKKNVFNEPIIVLESIKKILLESLIVSALIVLIALGIVKLLDTKTMIQLMWYLVDYPECIILPLFPILFFVVAFIRFIVISIKEVKE